MRLLTFLLIFSLLHPYTLLDKVCLSIDGEPILYRELKLLKYFTQIEDIKDLKERFIRDYLLFKFLKERGVGLPEEVVKNSLRLLNLEGFKREGFSKGEVRKLLKIELYANLLSREFLKESLKREGLLKYERLREVLIQTPQFKRRVLVKKGELLKELDEVVWSLKVGQEKILKLRGKTYRVKVLGERLKVDERSKELIEERLRELVKNLRSKSIVVFFKKCDKI